jgi:hypothetical protein
MLRRSLPVTAIMPRKFALQSAFCRNAGYNCVVESDTPVGACLNTTSGSMQNQRNSNRSVAARERSRCELMLGSTLLPAMLLNESQGGFAVLVGGVPSISANQKIKLRCQRGWFDARIVHTGEVVPTKAIAEASVFEEEEAVEGDEIMKITAADISEFTAAGQGPWFRLGIRCIRQTAPPTDQTAGLPVVGGTINPMEWIKRLLAIFA